MNTPREKIIEVMCDGWDCRPVSIEQRCLGLLAALEAAGYVVVPKEPTPQMITGAIHADDLRTGAETCKHIYRAMLTESQKET